MLQYIVELSCRNLLQIFRIEKSFGLWKAWIYSLRKCPATSMRVCGTEFLWRRKGSIWLNVKELSSLIFLIRHNGLSREPPVVEKEFGYQIKRKSSILPDFEILHLKSQSFWINYQYFIQWVLPALPSAHHILKEDFEFL